MAWPMPWLVTDALHDSEIARILPYAALRGQFGVLEPLHCAVRERETPGGGVRVATGGTHIPAIGFNNTIQSYLDYLSIEEDVPIEPTTSSGPRSDLVVVRVEDPQIPGGGWTWDPETEPIQYTRVIPNVPSDTFDVQQVRPGDSAITLCRIDIPGGPGSETATITDDMITDLRSIADIGGKRITENVIAANVFSEDVHATTGDTLPGNNSTFTNWPADGVWDVPVPEWATGVDVLCFWNPKVVGWTWGEARLVVDGTSGAPTEFDENRLEAQGVYRTFIKVGGTYSIPASARGQVVTFRLQCRQKANELEPGQDLGDLETGNGTYITFWLNFQKKPVYS